MARNPRQPLSPTKKHLARLERERRQRRYILLGSIAVIILVIATIGYGVLDQQVLQPLRAVAVVNGDKVSLKDWQAQTRYGRYTLVRSATQTYQFAQMFGGSDPASMSQFAQQLQQIQYQMTPTTVGQQVLDSMIDDKLIRQEAKRRGITVSTDELNKAFEAAFGFYPNGTPTPSPTFEPIPTQTLSPLQMTLVPPTATPTLTPTITATLTVTGTAAISVTGTPKATFTPAAPTFTPTATGPLTPTLTPTPEPTATPYTQQGYEKLKTTTFDSFKKDYNVTEADLRYVIESQLYRQKVMDAVLKEESISRTQEQVWARHILFATTDEAKANDALAKLKADPTQFCPLAKQDSIDTSNKDNCGDLGWFGKGTMDPTFEQAAWSLKVGEIVSQTVKTQFGFHIIQGMGHEDRPLSDSAYQQLRTTKFQDWLTKQKAASKVTTDDIWKTNAPAVPTLPAEINTFLQQVQQAQQQQLQTPAATSAAPAATP